MAEKLIFNTVSLELILTVDEWVTFRQRGVGQGFQ